MTGTLIERLARLLPLLIVLITPPIVLAQTPGVVSTVPTQNQLDVSVSGDISVTFDMDMDAATITTSTFHVCGVGGGPATGTVSYDAPSRTATFDPTTDFFEGEIVTAVLTGGIESSGGNALDGYAWSFTTIAAPAPATFPTRTDYDGGIVVTLIAADLDGDGDLDLATADAGGLISFVLVLMNNGDGTFADADLYLVTGNTWPVTASDLNGDGELDLVAGNNDAASFSVLLNNGDGTFADEVVHPTTRVSNSLIGADLDADGDRDLLMGSPGQVSVFLNNGDATFAPQTDYAVTVGSRVMSVFAADLDGDGALDIAATEDDDDIVSVFRSNGDGTFANRTTHVVGDRPGGVFAADFEGDGDLDLAVANAGSNDISVLLNQGGGIFAGQVTYGTGVEPISIFAADLDGDGNLDLLVPNLNFGVVDGKVSVFLSNGDGTFAPKVDHTVGESPISAVAGDLDGDGDLDVAVANRSSGDTSVLLNNGVVAVPWTPDAVTGFHILSASPTPAKSSLMVRFVLPEAMWVNAEVVSVAGERVRLLANRRPFGSGVHQLSWDGRSDRGAPMGSGVYYIRLTTPLGMQSAQTVLVR